MNKLISFFHYIVATGCGSGLSPVAPGTCGSLFGVTLVTLFYPKSLLFQVILILLTFGMGIYSANWVAESENRKDPSKVVIDEIAGIFVTFMGVSQPFNWPTLISGFLLFRLFDIWKPWLVKKAEALPGGWGIMLDDMVAGIFAAMLLHIGVRWL